MNIMDNVFYIIESEFDIRIEKAVLIHKGNPTHTVSNKKYGIVYVRSNLVFDKIEDAKQKEIYFMQEKMRMIQSQINVRTGFMQEFRRRIVENNIIIKRKVKKIK